MTDRERLLKILCEGECQGEENQLTCPERRNGQCKSIRKLEMCQVNSLADHILSDGWIRPPCKVGDTVYVICNKMVQETTVFSMKVETEDKNYVFYIKALAVDGMNKTVHGYATVFRIFVFGKTAFLTREEAEKARAERGGTNADR